MKQENRDPVFPLVVFPEKIRSVIESARSESNYPVSYIASAMLFAVSVAIGNCRTLIVNASWKVKAILFMSRATVFRYLNVEPGDPFLRRLQRGRYEKIE